MTAFDRTTLKRWRANPTAFIEECLCDPETKGPFVLLPAERKFLKHAFMVDENGRLLYPELIFACPKKSGKTTFAGIVTLPLILLHGGSYPEATICANDYDQSVARVFTMIKRIVECSPLLRPLAKIAADTITFPDFDATISAISSDYAGAAGGNQNIAVFDELWGVVSERGRRLWDEMIPPPTRKIACRLTVSYAGFSGESVLLEELYKRGMAQPEVAPGLRAGNGLLMAWHHEPIAPWQDEKWLSDMRRSLRPAQFLRMIENRWVSSESSFVDLSSWDRCVNPSATPVLSDKGLPIFVGVDASIKHDSTAIVAVTWDQQAQKVRLVAHRVFQPSPVDELNFEECIENTLVDLNRRFRIVKILCDPWQMSAITQRLLRQGLFVEEFAQSAGNLIIASQNLFELIEGRNLVLYPDAGMRLAVSRTIAIERARGWHIVKEKQTAKVDVVIALSMAALAAVRSPQESTLWTPAQVLTNGGLPVSIPVWASYVFAVLMTGAGAAQGEAAVCYFAKVDGLLFIVDLFVGPLTPLLFGQIVTRLTDLCTALHTRLGAVLTTAALAGEFYRAGYKYGVEVIDKQLMALDDGVLELRAAMHISQGRVKVCETAFAKYHPARFLDPTARDDNEPLKVAALLGVIMTFDQQSQGRAA